MNRFFRRLLAPALAGLMAAATLSTLSVPAQAQESSWERINETKTIRLGVAP